MKKVLLLVMLVLALFATVAVSTNQAQPVQVFNELVVDSPMVVATESDIGLLESDTEQTVLLTNGGLFNSLQNAYTDFKIETTAGTGDPRTSIFAVNIGFSPHLQIT